MKILSGVQISGMVLALFGSNVFRMLGFQHVPGWYAMVEKHGIQFAIFIYLLLPQILSKWIVTGAFEILLDGDTIFSKLDTRKMPKNEDLIVPLVEAGLSYIKAP